MVLPNYFFNVITFFVLGLLFGVIFDFFRSLRKLRKSKTSVVVIQDIIYFVIIFCIMLYSIYFFLDDDIRVYILVSIVLGAFVYFKLLSKIIIKIYIFIMKRIKNFLDFIFLPFKFFTNICGKLYMFFKKNCKKLLHKNF